MVRTALKRLVHLLIVLWLVSIATFFLLQLVPGDPATAVLGTSGTPEQYAQVREELGLDRPMVERYVDWAFGAVQGDFGRSLTPPYQEVSDSLSARLPVTLQIAAAGLFLALLVAVPVGIWSAHRKGEAFDRWASSTVFALMSLPTFLVGLLLIQIFVFNPGVAQTGVALAGGLTAVVLAVRLWSKRREGDESLVPGLAMLGLVVLVVVAAVMFWPSFPRQGFSRLGDGGLGENLRHLALPALTVALGELALFSRVLRAEMITTLDADFILAARGRGLPTHRILTTEALRPASFSIVTVAGLSLGSLMGGTLIVEVLFNLPGMGRLLVEAIEANDFVTVQAGVLVLAVIYVTLNAAVDIVYTLLDPRVADANR